MNKKKHSSALENLNCIFFLQQQPCLYLALVYMFYILVYYLYSVHLLSIIIIKKIHIDTQ